MINANEVKRILLDELKAVVDDHLARHQFTRKSNTVEYCRSVNDCLQSIAFNFEAMPSYHPGADCRILPQFRLSFQKLNEFVLEMTNGNKVLLGDPCITISQQVDLTVPKEQYPRWYAVGRDGIVAEVISILQTIEKWIIPLLNEYNSIQSLTKGYESRDPRIVWVRQYALYVIGAYVLQDEVDKAKSLLNSEFGKPGARRKYANVFEYFDQHYRNIA